MAKEELLSTYIARIEKALKRVKPGFRVRTHQHAENVFRYVIDGEIDITVGRRTYAVTKGMWVAVRAHTNYSLATGSNPGAKIFAAYQYTCKNL
jgi:uncharacterized cupin superfamily protein